MALNYISDQEQVKEFSCGPKMSLFLFSPGGGIGFLYKKFCPCLVHIIIHMQENGQFFQNSGTHV